MFKRNKHDYKATLERKLYLARENPEPVFDISECGLREVPSGVYSLCRVFLKEILLLDRNKLSSLNNGGSLNDLRSLKVLNMQHNIFTSLPKDIALLTNLKELYINNNKIKHLSSAISSLVSLRVLDASNNLLKELPSELGQLSRLEYLNVTGNTNLTRLPSTLCHASNLIILKLDTEHFIYPPADVVNKGVEDILRFLCDECGIQYEKPKKLLEESQSNTSLSILEDTNSRLQAQRQKEILKLEKDFETFHLKELELQAASKANRLKFLTDITQQQTKLEDEIAKIQNMKELEKLKLVQKLHEEELKADLAINQLINLTKQPFPLISEQEQMETDYLLSLTTDENQVLRRNDIIKAMQALVEKETADFKRYDQDREETARSILMQEILSNEHLTTVLRNQEVHQAELVSELQKDMELQRFAVGALLEHSDARSWSLVQQVHLVETQLAKLTTIEMDRHKLQIDEHINELADKRISLSILLIDLLEQQEKRRAELVETLNDMQQLVHSQEDFWLLQYQQLLDRRPDLTCELQRNIDPMFAHELLLAGVIHYLPFLATWIQAAGYRDELTDEDLTKAGIKSKDDRLLIIQAFHQFKKLNDKTSTLAVPSAPNLWSPDTEAATASAPPLISPEVSISSSECIICMDTDCQTVFIPCGHLCCCANCASPLENCPLCRCLIERKIKILMP